MSLQVTGEGVKCGQAWCGAVRPPRAPVTGLGCRATSRRPELQSWPLVWSASPRAHASAEANYPAPQQRPSACSSHGQARHLCHSYYGLCLLLSYYMARPCTCATATMVCACSSATTWPGHAPVPQLLWSVTAPQLLACAWGSLRDQAASSLSSSKLWYCAMLCSTTSCLRKVGAGRVVLRPPPHEPHRVDRWLEETWGGGGGQDQEV